MELKQYWSIVWKWMWLIVLATGIAAVSSYVATAGSPSIYQATTTLMVGQAIQSLDPNSGDIYTSQQLASTYIQIAKTDPVLKGAIEALGVKMSPDALSGMMNVSLIQGTQLIQISVVDTDPRRAQAFADELAHQLILLSPASKEDDPTGRKAFIQKQVDDLQAQIEGAQKQIQDLSGSIQVTASAREIADKQQQINTLQSQMTQWQTTYAGLLGLLSPRSPNQLSVVEPARLPTYPIAPNNQMTILVAAAIGCLLALGGAFLIEYIDDTIKSSEDAAQALGLSILGQIGRMSGDENDRLITARQPRSWHAEAYRVLRTNIQVCGVDKPIQTVMVTSANPVEGKSVTAANLALAMAQAGLRVILVDADFRRPSLHALFDLDNDRGLTNALLQSEPDLDGYAHSTDYENLQVLTSGPIPPNPAELVGSQRMQKLLRAMKEQADMIILDTPPALPVADPAILARQVDGVLFVVNAGRTRREAAVKGKEAIERAGGRILGVVLNRVGVRGQGYYYYYSEDGRKKQGAARGTRAPLARLWVRRNHREVRKEQREQPVS